MVSVEGIHQRWERITLSTKPVDRNLSERLVTKFYRSMDLNKPKCIWVKSPWDEEVKSNKVYETIGSIYNVRPYGRKLIDGTPDKVSRLIRDQSTGYWLRSGADPISIRISTIISRFPYGGFDYYDFAYWLSIECSLRIRTRTGYNKPTFLALELAKQVPWWRPHKEFCLLSERPESIKTTRVESNGSFRRVINNKTGPAIKWGNKNFYVIDGVRVPDYFVTNPSKVKDDDCMHRNAEVRRIAMGLYGHERFIKDHDGELVDHTEPYGKLWRVFLNIDFVVREIYLLEVTNRSPEPDGSFKIYFLQVPPPREIAREYGYVSAKCTAREAVAWTFDLRWDHYKPEIES